MTSSNQNINNELLEKMKACTSSEELKALLEDEDIDLSDEALDAIAGGIIVSDEEAMRLGWFNLDEGDTREGIDPSRVPAAFADGSIDGSAFF